MENGTYIELFAIKDGARYNLKVISMTDVAKILTTGLMDGMQKLWEAE